jgi:D-glycero-D-manno-heptose 1,7-bisphosphate phosphatase
MGAPSGLGGTTPAINEGRKATNQAMEGFSVTNRHVLVDRDGVINRRIPDGYVTSWEQFQFLPSALDALRLLAERNYKVIVVSNQACVGKGLMSTEELAELTRRFVDRVVKSGGRICNVYYCPHRAEDGCECRKPNPGLLRRAQREHGFVFTQTFLIGDSERDLIAAHQVGCPSVLVGGDTSSDFNVHSAPHRPSATVPDLYQAVQFILGRG